MKWLDTVWTCIFVLKLFDLIPLPWWIILVPMVFVFINNLLNSGE